MMGSANRPEAVRAQSQHGVVIKEFRKGDKLTMEIAFIPTHRIVFESIGVASVVIPVMLQGGEIWTRPEWDSLQPGQDWSNVHEWVVEGSDWIWLIDGLHYTPDKPFGKIHIESIKDSP